jgi:hypothetical protein
MQKDLLSIILLIINLINGVLKMRRKQLLTFFLLSFFCISSIGTINIKASSTDTGYNSDGNWLAEVRSSLTIYGGLKAGGGYYINKVVFHPWVKSFWPGEPIHIGVYFNINNDGENIWSEHTFYSLSRGTYVVMDDTITKTGYWESNIAVFATLTVQYDFVNPLPWGTDSFTVYAEASFG